MKKFFNGIIIAAAITLFAVSCSKSPTDPNGGGNGGGTTPQPTPSSFVEQLKTIGIVKAGEQQWDFRTIKEDATGKILTVEPMNGSKSGNLRGLRDYISSKLYDTFQDFKYYLSFNPYDNTASDGNGNPQNANSDALEIKITLQDKTTGNPVTDPDFKDGFTLKINANAKWAETPTITKEDIEESLHKVGNINLGLNFDFNTLTLNQVQQSSYSYETTLTVDNSSGKTADLILFLETVLKADSQTSYLKISYISPNGDDTFDVAFQTVSGDKVFNSSSSIKLIIVGTNPENPIFNLRDLNVSISGNPTLTTDNSGNGIGDKITINTDAPYLGLQATKIEQLSGTTVNIPSQDIGNYVYGSYYPPENVSHVFIEGEAVTLIHNTLKDGETAQFKVTFVAFCEGYNPKEGLELIINVQKGKTLPEITLDDLKNWLKIPGFTTDFNMGNFSLSALSDATPIETLNTIKEELKKLPQDKIVVKVSGYNSLEDLNWINTYPTGNSAGALVIFIKPVEGSIFSQELKNNLSPYDDNVHYILRIEVKPNNTWLPDISVEGQGKTADNPLNIDIGDLRTATVVPYTLKTPQGASIQEITVSELQMADGHADSWNILSEQLSVFENQYSPISKTELKIDTSYVNIDFSILRNKNIAKDSTQIYKVVLTVKYNLNANTITEKTDIYVNLKKNYIKTTNDEILKIFIEALSGQTFVDKNTPINIQVSSDAGNTLDIAKGGFSNSGKYFYASGSTTNPGSIAYLNGAQGLNNPEVISRLKTRFAEIGLIWDGTPFTFTRTKNGSTSVVYETAESKIKNVTIQDGYLFEFGELDREMGIELTIGGNIGWEE